MSKKSIFKIILLVAFTVLLVISSYAWFQDKSNPQISVSDIKVSAAEGLVIKLDPDSAGRKTVDLNSVLDSFDEFELKQVSSFDATNFYTIDFNEGLVLTDPEFVLLPQVDGSVTKMIENGYIDFNFYLQTENYPKHVYIHRDTKIDGPAYDALRISLSYVNPDNNNYTALIFGKTAENGISDEYTTKAIIKAGSFKFGNVTSDLYTTQLVRLFSENDGGRSSSDDNAIDKDRLLFTIPANTRVPINLKIWLEGGDIDCTNALASTYLNVLFKFGSANELLPAPTLTLNNNGTINGIDTTMEWSYTNDENSVWTKVTDTNQVFTQSVYVRISEVADVSPESYPTYIEIK